MIVYREIYCRDCDRIIGRYNAKYYTEARVGEIVNTCHTGHVKLGHDVEQRRVVSGMDGAAGAVAEEEAVPARRPPSGRRP